MYKRPAEKETETRLNSTRVCFTVVIRVKSFTRRKYQHAFTSMPKDVTGIHNRCLSHTRFAFNYGVSDNRRNCRLPAALRARVDTETVFLSMFGDRRNLNNQRNFGPLRAMGIIGFVSGDARL